MYAPVEFLRVMIIRKRGEDGRRQAMLRKGDHQDELDRLRELLKGKYAQYKHT
jgi:hypothetical protein